MTSFKQELKVKVEFEHFLENGTDAYFDTKHMGSTTTWNFHPKCGKVAVTSWEHGGKNSYHVYRLKNNVAADLMLWLKSTDDGLANRIISISFHYEKFEPRAMLEMLYFTQDRFSGVRLSFRVARSSHYWSSGFKKKVIEYDGTYNTIESLQSILEHENAVYPEELLRFIDRPSYQ